MNQGSSPKLIPYTQRFLNAGSPPFCCHFLKHCLRKRANTKEEVVHYHFERLLLKSRRITVMNNGKSLCLKNTRHRHDIKAYGTYRNGDLPENPTAVYALGLGH